MRSRYFWRIRSASALRFSKGCSSLNLDRMVEVEVDAFSVDVGCGVGFSLMTVQDVQTLSVGCGGGRTEGDRERPHWSLTYDDVAVGRRMKWMNRRMGMLWFLGWSCLRLDCRLIRSPGKVYGLREGLMRRHGPGCRLYLVIAGAVECVLSR